MRSALELSQLHMVMLRSLDITPAHRCRARLCRAADPAETPAMSSSAARPAESCRDKAIELGEHMGLGLAVGTWGLPCPSCFSWVLQLCSCHAGCEGIGWCPVRAGVTRHRASLQFASWGRSSSLPFAHASTTLVSCPKALNGSAASSVPLFSPSPWTDMSRTA